MAGREENSLKMKITVPDISLSTTSIQRSEWMEKVYSVVKKSSKPLSAFDITKIIFQREGKEFGTSNLKESNFAIHFTFFILESYPTLYCHTDRLYSLTKY